MYHAPNSNRNDNSGRDTFFDKFPFKPRGYM